MTTTSSASPVTKGLAPYRKAKHYWLYFFFSFAKGSQPFSICVLLFFLLENLLLPFEMYNSTYYLALVNGHLLGWPTSQYCNQYIFFGFESILFLLGKCFVPAASDCLYSTIVVPLGLVASNPIFHLYFCLGFKLSFLTICNVQCPSCIILPYYCTLVDDHWLGLVAGVPIFHLYSINQLKLSPDTLRWLPIYHTSSILYYRANTARTPQDLSPTVQAAN